MAKTFTIEPKQDDSNNNGSDKNNGSDNGNNNGSNDNTLDNNGTDSGLNNSFGNNANSNGANAGSGDHGTGSSGNNVSNNGMVIYGGLLVLGDVVAALARRNRNVTIFDVPYIGKSRGGKGGEHCGGQDKRCCPLRGRTG